MKRWMGILVVLLGLALCAWFVLGDGDSPQGALPTGGASDPGTGPALGGSGRRLHVPQPPPPGRAPTAAAPVPGTADREATNYDHAELTRSEASELMTAVPAGALRGLVVIGKLLMDGGTVELRHAADPDAPRPERALHELELERDGTFALEDAAPGTWWIRFHAPGTSARELTWRLDAGKSSRRLVIVLGTGSLAGRVHDGNGRPLAGMAVRAQRHGGTIGHLSLQEATTDDEGRYEVRGLLTGRYGVTLYPADRPYDAATARYATAGVRAGEMTALDFGSAARQVRWRGTVRNANGAPVRGPGRLIVQPAAGGEALTVGLAADGSFDVNVQPDVYRVTVQKSEGRLPVEDTVTVDARQSRRDLLLRGTQVVGGVVERETGKPFHMTNQGLYYTPKGATHHARKYVKLSKDGTFAIDALGPGSYVVSGWPRDLLGPRGERVVFEVLATDRLLELELETAPR